MRINGKRSPLRPRRAAVSRALALCALLAAYPTGFRAQQTQAPSAPAPVTNRDRLEVVEDLSESLANDLLDLSVATRDRNLERIAEFFPPQFYSAPFPCKPQAVVAQLKWVGTRQWKPDEAGMKMANVSLANQNAGAPAPAALRPTRREDFMRDWSAFLAHFAETEDVRFKLKESDFDGTARAVLGAEVPTAVEGATGRARIAFYVIGRNHDGKREWARGVFKANVRKAKANWVFDSFDLEPNFNSMVAREDLFSEVSAPAGVAAALPAYGTRGGGGFMWHGAAAADFNGDGWIDLFVTAPDRNYLYLNDGKGHFIDASEETGVKLLATGVAPLVLDYDNDGAPDIFISNVGGQILLQNRLKRDGKLGFWDVSNESGVGAAQAIGFSAVAGDVNGDGLPDVYVASYNRYGQITPDSWFRASNGTPNLLLINQGDGTFKEEAKRWGVDDSRWSYAAGLADVNGDGKLDLYVANDFGEKAMYINRGDHFVDEAKERGVLDPGNGMGVAFGDYNNDGNLDLHCTNMSSTAGNRILTRLFPNQNAKENVLKKLAAGNNLYEGDGRGHFRDVTAEVGGFSGGWAWGGGFIDFDNDGWEDIYTPNGFISGKSMKDT